MSVIEPIIDSECEDDDILTFDIYKTTTQKRARRTWDTCVHCKRKHGPRGDKANQCLKLRFPETIAQTLPNDRATIDTIDTMDTIEDDDKESDKSFTVVFTTDEHGQYEMTSALNSNISVATSHIISDKNAQKVAESECEDGHIIVEGKKKTARKTSDLCAHCHKRHGPHGIKAASCRNNQLSAQSTAVNKSIDVVANALATSTADVLLNDSASSHLVSKSDTMLTKTKAGSLCDDSDEPTRKKIKVGIAPKPPSEIISLCDDKEDEEGDKHISFMASTTASTAAPTLVTVSTTVAASPKSSVQALARTSALPVSAAITSTTSTAAPSLETVSTTVAASPKSSVHPRSARRTGLPVSVAITTTTSTAAPTLVTASTTVAASPKSSVQKLARKTGLSVSAVIKSTSAPSRSNGSRKRELYPAIKRAEPSSSAPASSTKSSAGFSVVKAIEEAALELDVSTLPRVHDKMTIVQLKDELGARRGGRTLRSSSSKADFLEAVGVGTICVTMTLQYQELEAIYRTIAAETKAADSKARAERSRLAAEARKQKEAMREEEILKQASLHIYERSWHEHPLAQTKVLKCYGKRLSPSDQICAFRDVDKDRKVLLCTHFRAVLTCEKCDFHVCRKCLQYRDATPEQQTELLNQRLERKKQQKLARQQEREKEKQERKERDLRWKREKQERDRVAQEQKEKDLIEIGGPFSDIIMNPPSINKAKRNPLGYTVWTSYDDRHRYSHPTKMFDSSFVSKDDANLRAKYVFYLKNPNGLSISDQADICEVKISEENVENLMKYQCVEEYGRSWNVVVIPSAAFQFLSNNNYDEPDYEKKFSDDSEEEKDDDNTEDSDDADDSDGSSDSNDADKVDKEDDIIHDDSECEENSYSDDDSFSDSYSDESDDSDDSDMGDLLIDIR